MSEIYEGFKLGNAAIELATKVFGPWITQRQAIADAQAEVQEALVRQLTAHMESFPTDPDVLDALISCGGKMNLINLAKIVQLAQSQLTESATPALIDNDWTGNFRDKARFCSDEQMAELWAQLLAGEANQPGSRSRKSINILADLDKTDAELFSTLCRFRLITFNLSSVTFPGAPPPPRSRFNTAPAPPILVVLDATHSVYTNQGIDFAALAHLEALGLVKVLPQGYTIGPGKVAYIHNDGTAGNLVLSCDRPIPLGVAYFTTVGSQLSELCFPLDSPGGFAHYLTEMWQSQGVDVGSDINQVIQSRVEVHQVDPETGERTPLNKAETATGGLTEVAGQQIAHHETQARPKSGMD